MTGAGGNRTRISAMRPRRTPIMRQPLFSTKSMRIVAKMTGFSSLFCLWGEILNLEKEPRYFLHKKLVYVHNLIKPYATGQALLVFPLPGFVLLFCWHCHQNVQRFLQTIWSIGNRSGDLAVFAGRPRASRLTISI